MGGKHFGSLVKTEFYCSRETFLEKFLFWKKYRFRDFLRASGDNFLTGFSKLNSVFPEEFFARKSLLEKFYHIVNVLRASVEVFYGRIVKTAVHNFRGTFFVKLFVWKSYRLISFLRASGENFFRSLVKTEFYCSRGTLLEKFLFWKIYRFIDFLRASGDNFLTELSKLLSTLTEEHCKRNFFWRKTFTSKVFGGLQVKIFPNGCQNCILTYQRNIGGEIFCLQKHKKS